MLESEEIVTGTFYFDEKQDLLYQKRDSRKVSFPVFKLKSLHFYDEEENINRKFIKIKTDRSISKFPYQLYEVVVGGEMKVLRKRKPYDYPLDPGEEKLSKEKEEVYNYHYYVYRNGVIYPSNRFYKEVYPLLMNENLAVASELLESKDFNLRSLSSIIQFVEGYNQLTKFHYRVSLF